MNTTLLITRPEKQAQTTAKRLHQLGYHSLLDPLLHLHKVDNPIAQPADNYAGMIISSANSLTALPLSVKQQLCQRPLLTTGKASQKIAQHMGFTSVDYCQGSAKELCQSVPNWMQRHGIKANSPLLYPCAQNTAHDLPQLLMKLNIECHAWPVYQTLQAKSFKKQTLAAFDQGQIDGVLLYSARTAACFVQLFEYLNVQCPDLFVLSAAIYQSLPEKMAQKCHFPDIPDEEMLLKLLP